MSNQTMTLLQVGDLVWCTEKRWLGLVLEVVDDGYRRWATVQRVTDDQGDQRYWVWEGETELVD